MQDKLDNDKRVKAPEGEEQTPEDEELDEALMDSFPASDPPAATQKGEPTSPPRGEEIDRKREADKSKKD
jgi:hypothetical protein